MRLHSVLGFQYDPHFCGASLQNPSLGQRNPEPDIRRRRSQADVRAGEITTVSKRRLDPGISGLVDNNDDWGRILGFDACIARVRRRVVSNDNWKVDHGWKVTHLVDFISLDNKALELKSQRYLFRHEALLKFIIKSIESNFMLRLCYVMENLRRKGLILGLPILGS